MRVTVLLLAAGSGKRLGSELPKQYLHVAGAPIIRHTLNSLAAEPRIVAVQPVIAEGDGWFAEAVAGHSYPFELRTPVVGGAERAISMANGLAALPEECEWVAVHDAARPLPSAALLADLFAAALHCGAAVPGLAVTDTIKRVDGEGRILETLVRSELRAVQTPQMARKRWLLEAMELQQGRLHLFTDDVSLLEAAGFPVQVSRGEAANRKITTCEDLAWLQAELAHRERS